MYNNKLSELLEQFTDAAVGISNGEIVAANSIARSDFMQPGERPVMCMLSEYATEIDGTPYRFAAQLNGNTQLFVTGTSDSTNPFFQLLKSINGLLREELGVAHASLNLLEKRIFDGDDVNKYLNIMRRTRSKLHRLADNLTDTLDEDRALLNASVIDLAELCVNLTGSVTALLDVPNVTLKYSDLTQPGESIVSGDPMKLERMLLNLISNAVLFAPESGCAVKLTISATDNAVIITIAQLYAESRHSNPDVHLFNAYGQERTAYGGLGLGMSAALHVARQHGGNIIASNRDNGVTFSVTIPRCADSSLLQDFEEFETGSSMTSILTALSDIVGWEKFGPPYIER
ncbi:MAG: HAMP domain-containing histidine kinase [Oscillospiraceae bacterium]|jgi:signal transduction histidine kinase|nr:HAMP domain-containing histidine kinase [Oscillospiraceae bacterium]